MFQILLRIEDMPYLISNYVQLSIGMLIFCMSISIRLIYSFLIIFDAFICTYWASCGSDVFGFASRYFLLFLMHSANQLCMVRCDILRETLSSLFFFLSNSTPISGGYWNTSTENYFMKRREIIFATKRNVNSFNWSGTIGPKLLPRFKLVFETIWLI